MAKRIYIVIFAIYLNLPKFQSMINVGILGAETMAAGELTRILINHPDVTLRTIASEQEAGRAITSLHRGLTGDTDLIVAPHLEPEGLDVVFLCGEPWQATRWMESHAGDSHMDELRIIDLTGAFRNGEHGMVYGFPEFNRKALVRGATRASVPSASAIAIEQALFPLAKNSMLDNDISVAISMATSEKHSSGNTAGQGLSFGLGELATSTRLDPIAPQEHRCDSDAAASEAAAALRMMQPSASPKVRINMSRDESLSRGLTAVVRIPCRTGIPELQRIYDDAYHDHGFTFPVETTPQVADVANTNKCLLQICYPDSSEAHDFNSMNFGVTDRTASGMPHLQITVVIDNLLKGGAGTAVHCMNLLFGLSEKTGLALKASAM